MGFFNGDAQHVVCTLQDWPTTLDQRGSPSTAPATTVAAPAAQLGSLCRQVPQLLIA
jgi:hypothetical protein